MSQKMRESDVHEFIRSVGLLLRRVRAAASSHEISLSENLVLSRLEHEGPATTAELAHAESVKPQSMGATIAALEERGLVERKPHPTDGRQFNIQLTSKGAAIRTSTREAKYAWLSNTIAQLDKHDQATLFAAGQILKRLVNL